jgi:Ca2+-binding RTX toxin-like protein
MSSGSAIVAVGLTAAALLLPVRSAAEAPAVRCDGRAATILGTAGNDRIEGTAGDDVIAGLGGNDRLAGLAGDDVLCGGPGDDDLTSYDKGRDVLVGGTGDDFVGSFENPHARVRTGPGDDYASVQAGADPGWSFDGGPGRDHIFLNLTREVYDAGPVPDVIHLPSGRIRFSPGKGEPWFLARFAGWEELDLPNQVRWRVTGTDADERFLFEGLQGIWVRTLGGDDEVLGTPGDDVIITGDGEDTVTAYDGDDLCRGAERTRGCETLTWGARRARPVPS